ncbi:MAG: hypothetical protein H7Y12_01665 [Sphingobacteriaceae bacterium]|nr:hypothetical protein [Cytophagaceae bacterium]
MKAFLIRFLSPTSRPKLPCSSSPKKAPRPAATRPVELPFNNLTELSQLTYIL